MGYGGALDVTEGHTWWQSRHLRLSPEKQSHLPDKQTYMRWSVAESERERGEPPIIALVVSGVRLTSFLCMPFACLSLQSKKEVVPVVPKGKKERKLKPVKEPEPESEEDSSSSEEEAAPVSAPMLLTNKLLV